MQSSFIQPASQQATPTIIIIDFRNASTPPRESSAASQPQESGNRVSKTSIADTNLSQTANRQAGSSASTASKTDVAANAVLVSNQDASGDQARTSASLFSFSGANLVQSPTRESIDNTTVGTIETLPLMHRELHSPPESETDGSWQLDTHAIERIREVAKTSVSPSDDDTDRNTDAAIASWFNEQTGLMEIEATGKLQTPVDLTHSIVNVALDATVGLPRSVDMIAAATPDPDAIPDIVRAAILASIAAEQPSPISDIATEPTQARVGSVTYCATTVIAVTAAAAARRRKAAKMESTGR